MELSVAAYAPGATTIQTTTAPNGVRPHLRDFAMMGFYRATTLVHDLLQDELLTHPQRELIAERDLRVADAGMLAVVSRLGGRAGILCAVRDDEGGPWYEVLHGVVPTDAFDRDLARRGGDAESLVRYLARVMMNGVLRLYDETGATAVAPS